MIVPSLAGTRLDKYEVLEEVGHGGMAIVYRGIDTDLQREVAIKVLHAHLADRPESRQRLKREAIAVAKLRHDNIVEIFDYSGPDTHESYIVTEFIHGPTLRQWMDDAFEPRPTIAALLIHRVALALDHAHQTGVIHRDIKPENVMVRSADGCLKLMDFGIAQLLDNQKLTMTGQLIGSPAYMAPELINGRPLDARTDLFSLGIMLYQLATGELPFLGRNPHEVLNRIADGDYTPASHVNPAVDRELQAIIDRALALLPDDRYPSMAEFARELERYLAHCGIDAHDEDLREYFEHPETYLATLDTRVAAALLQRADDAARGGQNAHAIALLARVLEIAPTNAEANAMLVRLRKREQRLRQGLLVTGLVAAGGMVTAGMLLLPADQMALEPSLSAEPIAEYLDHIPTKLSVSSDEPDPRSPALVRVVDAPLPDHEPVAATTKPTDDPPNDSESLARVPRRLPPSEYECDLRIHGIPMSSLRNVKIKVGSHLSPIKMVGPDTVRVHVDEPEPVLASIVSPRHEGFTRLTFRACQAGPVRISATNKDAEVTFDGAPSELSVQCIRGCPAGYKSWVGTTTPPRRGIPIRAGHSGIDVSFVLKSACHRSTMVTHRLRPGPNRISVQLKPLPDCE